MFNISVNFKDTNKMDHKLESPIFTSRHLSIIWNQRRYLSRPGIPMFIGTPCIKVSVSVYNQPYAAQVDRSDDPHCQDPENGAMSVFCIFVAIFQTINSWWVMTSLKQLH